MYIVSSTIALEISVPEVPLQASVILELFSDTAQLLTDDALHVISVVSPDCSNVGPAVIEMSGLNILALTVACPPFEHTTVYVVSLTGTNVVEPETPPPVEKLTPALEELGEAHSHASSIESPSFTEILDPVPPPVEPLVP
ncbi:MAG: hypothetical protein WEB94_01020 [Candidatus Paceibacterota bacterium]